MWNGENDKMLLTNKYSTNILTIISDVGHDGFKTAVQGRHFTHRIVYCEYHIYFEFSSFCTFIFVYVYSMFLALPYLSDLLALKWTFSYSVPSYTQHVYF